jgi:hypothetical protein
MSKIEDARALISSTQTEIADLRKSIKSDKRMSTAVLEDLQERLKRSSSWNRSVKDLEDLPGLKVPKWYTVEIPFDYGDTSPKTGEVIISAEGPFVCTQIQTYYRITDTDTLHYSNPSYVDPLSSTAVGRLISATSFFPLMGDLQVCSFLDWQTQFSSYSGSSGGVGIVGHGYVYPEFDLQIHIEGSGRAWAGDRTPAAAFYGVGNPLFTGISGVVEHSDRIEVVGAPSIPKVTLAGKLTTVFHGYHIGGTVDFYESLGY